MDGAKTTEVFTDYKWLSWYAWRPVRLEDGGWIWRRQIQRKFEHVYDLTDDVNEMRPLGEYRLPR